MNSTGLKLNPQELRNAAYAGSFKTCAYELANEQLDRWRNWGLFSGDQIARMREVDLVSDLLINMQEGLSGKSQSRIDRFYEANDLDWPGSTCFAERFRQNMDLIDSMLGDGFRQGAWRSEVNFFTLFAVLYDLQWGLGGPPDGRKPKAIPVDATSRLRAAGEAFKANQVPSEVLDAMQRASADLGRRRTRFMYLRRVVETG